MKNIAKSFLLAVLCFCFSLKATEHNSLPIDLTKEAWYSSEGFNFDDVKNKPDFTGIKFKKINKFPIVINKTFAVPIGTEIREYTLFCLFNIKTERIDPGKEVGFYFSGIGESWSVYLNGELIKDEYSFNNGKIEKYKSVRSQLISIPYGILKKDNILTIRIAGYMPASFLSPNIMLGLRFNEGYYIDYEKNIRETNNQLNVLLFNAVYIFFGFYHLFFFVRWIQKRYNLYFGVFSLLISSYFISFSGFAYDKVDDTRYLLLVAFSVQPLALLSFLFFLDDYFYPERKLGFFYKYSLLSNLFSAFCFFVLPVNYYHTVLFSWYILAIPQILYIFYFIFKCIKEDKKDSVLMAVSISFILITVIWEILDTIFFNTGIRVFHYTYFTFILSLVAILANRFIEINWETKRLNHELIKQRDSFFRFVPVQFLELLGRDSAVNISLGDCKLQEMTILFCDIRNFTTLSEVMSPEDNFKFINSYLKKMTPIIQSHNGFIDKFIGDAIMAIFPEKPDDALSASIEIIKELEILNKARERSKYKPIKIGVGINTGSVMMGTVGNDNRMNTTVIGDSVNLASRFESLNKDYNTSILLSEFTVSRLKDRTGYKIREIDAVIPKGKTIPVKVYECFDIDTDESIERKLQSIEDLNSALYFIKTNKQEDALDSLEAVLFKNPNDPVALYHLNKLKNLHTGQKG